MSFRAQALTQTILTQYLGSEVSITAQLITDPNRTSPKVSGRNYVESSWSFLASAIELESSAGKYKLKIPIRVLSPAKNLNGLLPGQTISGRAVLVKSKEARVAALVFFHGEVKIETTASRWARSLGALRFGLRDASGDGDAGALIPGMVLGDTSKQTAEFKLAMKRSGLTHLVAVSGANFAIVSGFVLWLMQFIFRNRKYRISATALSLIFLIALVRPSPSVLRAAAMAAVVLFAMSHRRAADSLPALGFAMAAVVIADPWQARDAGFALSVLATGGLLLAAPKIIALLQRFMPKKLAESLAPPIAAVLFCAPVLVALSGFLSPMSIIANLLAAPAVAPITVLGFIAALIHPFLPGIAAVLILLIRIPAAFIGLVAKWSASFSVLELGKGASGFLAILVIASCIWIFRTFFRRHRKAIAIVLVALLVASNWATRFPGIDWQVGNCDIGQGDAMVINLGQHRGVVIDVGPDPQLIDKCLKQFSIKQVSILILTHFHADHVEGLPGLLKGRSLGQVWVSPQIDPAFESARVQSWLGEIPQIPVTAGFTAQIQGEHGAINLQAIWPKLGAQDTPNNSSIVMKINSADFSLLAAGDIEPIAQAQLVQQLSQVDLYKVAHHGSRYQDLDFMRALSPRISIISVGKDNSYGHPAPQTIAALSRIGSTVYRTDLDGALAINARRHQVKVRKSHRAFKFWEWG
ncbi:ComEC family competence protein [Candidatus Nanopelagicaceae bacterium]